MAVKRNNSKRAKAVRDKIKDTYCTCFFCGEYIYREYRTIDHLISLAKGGLDEEDNMVVSCHQCNSEKADLDVDEYVKLKLEGFDFKARAEENKRKRGFGYEGAIYEELILPMYMIISRPRTSPNPENIEKRKELYLSTGKFQKPTYVKKRGKRYIILQGFINYKILQSLGATSMPVTLVVDNSKNNDKDANKH